jgi:ketosteroid isomerase-like protein
MSRENVEVVRASWEAVVRSGPDGFLAFAHPDLEWHVRKDLPDAGVYRGHDGFRALAERFNEAFAEQSYDPEGYIPAGDDMVVVPLRWWARGRESGASLVESEETWVFVVRDGKIVRVDEYATRAEALEAVGLSE